MKIDQYQLGRIMSPYPHMSGMCQSLKIWGARSNAVRRRCRRRLLICQNLGGHVPRLPPPLWHMTVSMKNVVAISNTDWAYFFYTATLYLILPRIAKRHDHFTVH